jgi:signal transduction histidine kinase
MASYFIAGFFLATGATFFFASGFFVQAWRHRREDREYLLFGLATLFPGMHALSAGAAYFSIAVGHPERVGALTNVAFASCGPAAALVFHFACRFAGRRHPSLISAGYAVAGVTLLVALLGFWRQPVDVVDSVTWFGVRVPAVHTGMTWLGASVSLMLLSLVAAAGALLMLAYTRDSSPRTTGAVVLGALLLLVSAVHDALSVGIGLFESVSAIPLGHAAFVLGVALTFIRRHERITVELATRRSELNERSVELEQSLNNLQRAQADLLQSEQLAVVGEFAAVITSEVRNPMGIVNDAVTTLSRAERVNDDTRSLLIIIEQEMSRLERMVTHLLNYAKPVVPQKQAVPLARLVDACVTQPLADHPDITLRIEGGAFPSIYVDLEMMKQTFDNIVANAIQAMDGRGELVVRVARRKVDGVNATVIGFEDTGVGMTEHQLEQAMSPFYTTRPAGTGLGLAICERIVDAHGGMLVVSSERGVGTAASIVLADRPEERLRTTRRAMSMPPLVDDIG